VGPRAAGYGGAQWTVRTTMAFCALHADFPGEPPKLAHAEARIATLKRRRRDSLEAALVLSVAIVLAILWSQTTVAALLAGLVAALASAGLAHMTLSDLVAECALFAGMGSLPDVARRQSQLVAPERRHQLAVSLRKLADDRAPTAVAGWPGSPQVWIPRRVTAARTRLLDLAWTLDRAERADPIAVARLEKLLRDGIFSPLYNPTVPAEELDVILRQLRWRLVIEDRDRCGIP
jgi:hypothetical protein